MLFENIEKNLDILNKGQNLPEKKRIVPPPKNDLLSILEKATDVQEGRAPDPSKESQENIIKKLLEMAVKEEDLKNVDQKEGKAYLGMSGDNAYYTVINKNEDGTIKDVTVYDATDEEIKSFDNSENKPNVEMV